MSRLDQATTGQGESPLKYTVTFKGNNGSYKYYDREAKEEVLLKSLEIVLLTEKKSVTGFNDESESSIYSNFVSNLNEEDLTVKAFKAQRPLATGKYADIKDTVVAVGGKLTNNLICLANIGGDWVVANLELSKSSLGAWIEYNKAVDNKGDLYTNTLVFGKGESKKKGSIKYVIPSIEFGTLDKKLADLAEEKYELVKEYFTISNIKVEAEEIVPSKDQPVDTTFDVDDDLPF